MMTLRVFKLQFLLALSFLMFFRPSIALADGSDYPFVESQPLIDACWAISEKERSSGVTAQHREGALNSVLCLENAILDQLEVLFPNGKYLSREEAAEKLEQLRFAAGSLYWSIYNEHQGCDPSCGTAWHSAHLSSYARILEKIVRDVVTVRNMYRF